MDFKYGTYGYIAMKDKKAAFDNITLNPNVSASSSQQAFEKILKHYIKEIVKPDDHDIYQSHNLNRLVNNSKITELNSRYKDIKLLRDIYYDTRYPGEDYWDVDSQAAEILYNISAELIQIVMDQLNCLHEINGEAADDSIRKLKEELESL